MTVRKLKEVLDLLPDESLDYDLKIMFVGKLVQIGRVLKNNDNGIYSQNPEGIDVIESNTAQIVNMIFVENNK